MNIPVNAIFHSEHVEVQEQAYTNSGELQVRHPLGLVDREDPRHRLQLDENHTFHQQVDPVAAVEPHTTVEHRLLPLAAKPALE